ncbi:caspase-7 [Manduca sexta]|uniref:caspase-7 n=1 Tax=Manduca sexta TaxID=7130 RepID=UPI00189042BF|nr:caspase-7 [Manduca sexta]
MEGENKGTNIQNQGTELQKKRKRKKRGKQKIISEDVDNGSCVSNIVEVDAPDNANTVENIDLITNKSEIDENPRFDKNTNENTEYHEGTTDTLHSQSSSQVETCEHLFSDSNNNDPPHYEHLKDENLSADIKNNIVVQNLVTDGIPSSCENPSAKVLHDGNKLSTQLSSESDKKFNRSISSTTKNLIQLYNPRALPKESETYELEKFDKNKLIIFNQIKFGQYERLGTEADLKSLKTTFEAFNFEVQDYPDPTVDKIEEILNEISVTDYSDYGCLAIAVLTHGGIDGKLLAADGDYYEIKIINFLKTHKNHSLITKPRLLFVQACRGPNSLIGVPVLQPGKVQSNLIYDTEPYTLPVEADMLVVHSSYVGNRAVRHQREGSWFIQTLCKKINEMASTHDLETILTHIKREVAIDKEKIIVNRVTKEHEINKQMPVVTTTLIRKLYLKRSAAEENALNTNGMPTDVAVDSYNTGANPKPELENCRCNLNYFDYIKECLRHFLQDNNDYKDTTGRSLLNLTDTLKNEEAFNATKEKCAMTIADYLETRAKHCQHYKYIYINKK